MLLVIGVIIGVVIAGAVGVYFIGEALRGARYK
jgi:hypothetical protein